MTPDPFLTGLRDLRARRYFEAHEAWEELWQPEPEGQRREFLQAGIQLAVALEHLRRGNPNGSFAVWNKARAKLKSLPEWVDGVGIGPWAEAVAAFMQEARLADRVRAQLEGGVAADAAAGHIEGLPPLPPDEAWPVPPVSEELAARLEG